MNTNRNFQIFCPIILLSTVAMAFTDLPALPRPDWLVYIAGRLFTSVIFGWMLIKSIQGKLPRYGWFAIWSAMGFYTFQGQIYRDTYFLAYYEWIIVTPILIPMTKWQIRILSTIAFALFVMCVHVEPRIGVTHMTDQYRTDLIFGAFVMNVVALLTHQFITYQRMIRDELFRKFADMGKYASHILHDLKAMVSAPTMYSELIKRELHNHPDANVKEWLENLNRDLDQLQRFVREVNQLSVAREQREESFAVSEIVESARVVLETKLDGITLRRDGDLLIHADRNRMLRILLNVISNASDAISASKPAVPEIVVKSSGNTIAIHDNGGGFDVATLAKIEKRVPVSSKSSGGLGMLIIRDYVDELGGTVRFYNDGAGAVVEVMIPTQRINAEMPRA